ncbi:43478_t:CDS:2 [Gigaspora margarita]|uniref:43478_t:CDS:1 n=1 Tax=Gigaspora margarita TaxID=4874 RepID=A0ABN7W6R5_GIGMA|nr:43478_t:CDS:2 [Gigaspora margarita]
MVGEFGFGVVSGRVSGFGFGAISRWVGLDLERLVGGGFGFRVISGWVRLVLERLVVNE